MEEHPINQLMEKAMENIKKMVHVSTVVGDAVETENGTVIIPVTKVSCGFAAGGSEFEQKNSTALPFGGGSGGGVSIQPIGFLVVSAGEIRFQTTDNHAIFDRLIDEFPDLLSGLKESFTNHMQQKTDSATPTFSI